MTDLIPSSTVKNQLPDFIRNEYPQFITFLEKYYEWMESGNNAIAQTEQLSYANEIDLASDFYVEKLKQELLPYLPTDLALDKRKFLKFAVEFYKSKGTINSIKFLFRTLFNENIDIYLPGDDILIASDGRWALPLALRIDTNDNNIFNIRNTKITGVVSKATALVENVIRSVDRQLGIQYIEVYISNVERIFETGETVYATYIDENGLLVTVTGRIVGALSNIKINPEARGLYYNTGDPVTILGGLNPNSNNPIGAIATVGEVTRGSVTNIFVENGGFGFRNPSEGIDTNLVVFRGGFDDITQITEATAQISLVDTNYKRTLNVSSTLIEEIITTQISTVENTEITLLSSFQDFNVYSISAVAITGGGGGYRRLPETNVLGLYLEEFKSNETILLAGVRVANGSTSFSSTSIDLTTLFSIGDYIRFVIPNRYEAIRIVTNVTAGTVTFDSQLENLIENAFVYSFYRRRIDKLGALGRLQIVSGGQNYQVGEQLVFAGGSGYGANAEVTAVDSSNSNTIISVEFVQDPNNAFLLGGEGYEPSLLPTITISTANGANAVIVVTEVAGDGEKLDLSTSRVGAISSLRVASFGYDYVQTPTISLRNMDLTVANVTEGVVFVQGTKVYQGSSNAVTTFNAYVDRFITANNSLRLYDYQGTINQNQPIISDDETVDADIVSGSIKFYGDGRALATATFENGLIRYPGIYLNTYGFLNWDKRLRDYNRYNDYTYAIKSNYDYKFFKNTVSDLIHPVGMKAFATRIETHEVLLDETVNVNNITIQTLPYTFNVAAYSNTMITDAVVDLSETVNVGDVVILTEVQKPITGTINVSGNVIIGTGTNFINDLLDGDKIILSTGNTTYVGNIISANTLITTNTINITSNLQTLNLIFNDTKAVSNVSGNTITVSTNFTTNSNSIITLLEKVK